MKKNGMLLLIIFILVCCSCSKTSNSEECLDCPDNYEEGYKQGRRDAVEQIMEEAKIGWEIYVNIDDVEEIMRLYFGDEADEIRDMILYDPDLKKYEKEDIVNEVLKDSGLDYYYNKKEQE